MGKKEESKEPAEASDVKKDKPKKSKDGEESDGEAQKGLDEGDLKLLMSRGYGKGAYDDKLKGLDEDIKKLNKLGKKEESDTGLSLMS